MILDDEVIYDDGWKVKDLRALRRDSIGFILSATTGSFLGVLTLLPLAPMLAGKSNAEAQSGAGYLLKALDVEHRAKAMPSQLSEQQQVAIARGLVQSPSGDTC